MKQDTSTWPPFARIGYESGWPVGQQVGYERASQPGASPNYAGKPDSNPATYGYSMPEPYYDNSVGDTQRPYDAVPQWRDAWSLGFTDGFMEAYYKYFEPKVNFTPPSSDTPFDPNVPVPGSGQAPTWPGPKVKIPLPGQKVTIPWQPWKYVDLPSTPGKIRMPVGNGPIAFDPGFRYSPGPEVSNAPDQGPGEPTSPAPAKGMASGTKALLWVGGTALAMGVGYALLKPQGND